MATLADKGKKQQYIKKAREMEDAYGIPPYTLVGLLETESNFNQTAVSKSGAKGLAQFMDGTAKEYGINPYNATQSIEAAAKYLSSNYQKLGNWEDTVLSYNMGLQGTKDFKAGKKTQNKEQREYTQKVFTNRGKYIQDTYTQPSTKDSITTNITNFEYPQINNTFASVPEEKKEEKVDKDVQEVEQQTAEQKFLEEYSKMQQQAPPVQYADQEEQQPLMTTDIIGTYNNVSNFVENDVAQEGGEKIIDDNMGQYNHPGKVTRISSPFITMKDVPYDILAVADSGEKRIMKPNEEHYFKNAKTVTEYPQLTEAEKRFLKEIYG